MNFEELKEKIAKIREDYNKNSGLFYGFFDEVVAEINAILLYLKELEEQE